MTVRRNDSGIAAIKRRLLVFIGVGYLLLGFFVILINNRGITGFFVFEGLGNGIGKIAGIVFVLVGVLVLTVSTLERNKESGLKELIKPSPGGGFPGKFMSIRELMERGETVINKIKVEYKNGEVYRNGRLIQGLKIKGDYVEFLGYHFTSPKAAKLIEDDHRFEILNKFDPYIYFLEPMHYSERSVKSIKYLTGSNDAQDLLVAEVRYPIDKVHLKIFKDYPTSIAVDGDIDIHDLVRRKGKYIDHKLLGDS